MWADRLRGDMAAVLRCGFFLLCSEETKRGLFRYGVGDVSCWNVGATCGRPWGGGVGKRKSQEPFGVLGLQFSKGLNGLDLDIIIHRIFGGCQELECWQKKKSRAVQCAWTTIIQGLKRS
jgi:hypothetical protein